VSTYALIPSEALLSSGAQRWSLPVAATIFTSMFLHGVYPILPAICSTSGYLAIMVEDDTGRLRFILFYLCAACCCDDHALANKSSIIR